MTEKNSGQLKQLALEEIASQQRFLSDDLDMLGRLLDLINNPKIESLRLECSTTSHSHYEARLNDLMEPSEVKQILISQGLKLGKYDNGRPFYNFVSESGMEFYLKIKQPDGTLVQN